MKLKSVLAAAALAGAAALPFQSAEAWWGPGYGGGPWSNSGWGDMLGDGAFDMSFSGRGRGTGSGYGYGYNNPYYYGGYPYGYGAPWYGPYGAPGWGAPAPVAPQSGGGK